MQLLTTLPSPLDIPAIKGTIPDTDEEVERHSDDRNHSQHLHLKL